MTKALKSAFNKIGFEGTEEEWRAFGGRKKLCRELEIILSDSERLSSIMVMQKGLGLPKEVRFTKAELQALFPTVK